MAIFNPNSYFKQLAIEHVDIKHTDEKPAYFREYSSMRILFNNSDFLDQMRYANRTALVSQFNGDGGISGKPDSKVQTYTGSIYIITRIIDKDKDEAFALTTKILQDIFARMQEDLDNMIIPITMSLNDIKIISLDEIGDGYYGHTAMMAYKESAECIAYDSNKWQQA